MGDQPSTPYLVFPRAQQAQIIRANQRDLYHVSRLREQAENVLRYWLGSRWLARWDKELDLLVKLSYFGLTSGRGTQTLGEEYTNIWQYSSFTRALPPSPASRASLVTVSLLLPYILGRWGQNPSFNESHPILAKWLRRITTTFDIAVEVNLATFYIRGTYYDPLKRLMGIQHLSSHPPNPHTRPPSYSLLGVMIALRLLYRLVVFIPHQFSGTPSGVVKGKERAETSTETYIDDRPVSSLLDDFPENDLARPAEEDERIALDVSAIPATIRSSRKCTLCLEERTDSCATECGHLFCWNCIFGWGRERAECPLCRQSLSLKKLLPIYNL